MMKFEDFTEKELAEARSQLCFNICSHHDEKFSINSPEKSIVKMSIEGNLSPWLLDIMIDEFSKN